MTDNARTRVLIVDDEPDMLEMLEYVLSQRFEVTRARSGREALDLLSRNTFDLAVTDFKMPDMDGLETLIAIRDRCPDVVVIVVSGYASREQEQACHRHGAFAFISKPFDLIAFRNLLERAADHQRSLREPSA